VKTQRDRNRIVLPGQTAVLRPMTSKSDIFRPLLEMTPWNVRLGVGSFLTMEFGEAQIHSARREKRVHGQWHLWLQDCVWRIEKGGKIVAGSEDEHDELNKAIYRLEFGALSKAEITEDCLDLDLLFNGDIRLRTFTVHSSGEDQWELFGPDGMVTVAHAGGVLEQRPSGTPKSPDSDSK